METNVNLNVSNTICFGYSNLDLILSWMFKGLFTPSKSERESEKDQRINGKHQTKFLLSLSLDLNTTLSIKIKLMVSHSSFLLIQHSFVKLTQLAQFDKTSRAW